MTVTQFSKIVAAANGPLRNLVKEERALYLKFAEQQQPCLVLEGNELRLRLPITRTEFEKLFGPNTDVPKHLAEFKRAGGKLSFADNEMTWSIGMSPDQATTLTLPMAEKPYVPNAVSAVKNRAVIREKLDIAAAAKEFVNGTSQEKKPAKP